MLSLTNFLKNRLFLPSVLFLSTILIIWIGNNAPTENASLLLPEFTIVKTTPPPEVAIELDETQLNALKEAYENGFDHPDPSGDDPCKRLQLLPHKKLSAWRKQFRKRGFTINKVKDMIINGRREPFTHPQKGVTLTKIFDDKGNWIVIDFIDCLIWQVAPHNFK